MKKLSSKDIALAGISAGLTMVCIILSVYLSVIKITFFMLSTVFTSLCAVRKMYKAGILTYISVSILSLIFFNIKAIPYIVFFGALGAFVPFFDNSVFSKLNKRLAMAISWAIRIVYFQIAIFIIYKFMGVFIANLEFFGKKITLPLIYLLGNICMIALTILFTYIFKYLSKFIGTKVYRDFN